MPINYSVWAIKPGKKGFAKRYPPSSYPAADVLKVSLMNAHQDEDVFLFIMKERTPVEPSGHVRSGRTKRSRGADRGNAPSRPDRFLP
jgi:hypothetical protein